MRRKHSGNGECDNGLFLLLEEAAGRIDEAARDNPANYWDRDADIQRMWDGLIGCLMDFMPWQLAALAGPSAPVSWVLTREELGHEPQAVHLHPLTIPIGAGEIRFAPTWHGAEGKWGLASYFSAGDYSYRFGAFVQGEMVAAGNEPILLAAKLHRLAQEPTTTTTGPTTTTCTTPTGESHTSDPWVGSAPTLDSSLILALRDFIRNEMDTARYEVDEESTYDSWDEIN